MAATRADRGPLLLEKKNRASPCSAYWSRSFLLSRASLLNTIFRQPQYVALVQAGHAFVTRFLRVSFAHTNVPRMLIYSSHCIPGPFAYRFLTLGRGLHSSACTGCSMILIGLFWLLAW